MGGAACAKIILNGRNGAALLTNAVELVVGQEYLDNSDEIIKHLNAIENAAVEVQIMILKARGYDGPVGKMHE